MIKYWTNENKFSAISFLLLFASMVINLVYNIRFALWYQIQHPHH